MSASDSDGVERKLDSQDLCQDDPPLSNLPSGPAYTEPCIDDPANIAVEEDDRGPKPPDGGWGWVIVFASALSHVIIGGVERSGGVLYLQLIKKFNKSASITSWAMSLSGGFRLLTGPFASALTNRFGFRRVVFVGGVAAALGCVLSAFSPQLFYVHLAFGLLGGIGRGLSYTPSVVIVGTYFDKRRGVAVGLATAGVGLGTFFLPPLLELLFEEFGYAGAFLILAGYTLHICVCAVLYRPLSSRKRVPRSIKTQAEESASKPVSKLTRKNEGSVTLEHSDEIEDRSTTKTAPLLKNSSESPDVSNTSKKYPRRKSLVGKTKKLLQLELLRNPFFLAFCVTIGLFTMAFQIILAFLPALGESKGLTSTQSALLLSIMGITDILARIFSGVVFDLRRVRPHRRYLYNACLILISVTALMTPLARDFGSFLTVSLVYGVLAGLYIAQKSVIIVDIVGKDKLIGSFGLVVWFQGIGTFIGPPIAGIFRDTFNNYDLAFQFGGGMTSLASVILLVSNICFFCRTRREDRAKALTVDTTER